MKPYRFVAKNPAIDITIPGGDGPAIPGGFGGWVTVALQDDIEGVDWEGQPPLTEDVPLLLNGLEENRSVQREWNTVKKLGRDPNGDEHRPPVFRVWGPVDAPEGKAWVLPANGIEIINNEETVKRNDGDYLRVEFVLHLLEYTAPEVIKARRRKRKRKPKAHGPNSGTTAPGKTYKAHKGDTLEDIAAAIYDDPSRWKEIAAKNNLTDPHKPLPAGRVLRLP